ncbi:MAG: hypothetical protein ACOC4M_09000 [Promethearchaeia archaeon]
MVVREAGIIFRGFNLVNAKYHQTHTNKVDKDLRSSLITALLNFCEGAFSSASVEYFELKKFSIAFTKSKIQPTDSEDPEDLIVYAIFDSEKGTEKYIRKILQPLLKSIANEFIQENEGKNLSEITQFRSFTPRLDDIFGDLNKTIDNKFKSIF